MKLFDQNGTTIEIGKELGRGGEGSVFGIENNNDVVAKIYHNSIDAQKALKLTLMVSSSTEQLQKIATWPVSTLHKSRTAHPCGFIMPKLKGYAPIHTLYSPAHRKQDFERADWEFLIHASRNLAGAVETLHSHGYVLGDINQGNVFVSKDATIKVIDCDSIQFTHGRNSFLSEVGVAHFTPPELQRKSFSGVLRTPNHDNFGLAVLCFHLLFMGRHPFAGRFLGKGDMPIEQAIAEYRFAFSHAAPSCKMERPPNSIPITAVTPLVAELFEKAFGRCTERWPRPTAQEWRLALEHFKTSLRRCAANPIHKYFAALTLCPWCDFEKTGTYFFVVTLHANVPESTDFHELWRKVEEVLDPGSPSFPSFIPPAVLPLPLPRQVETRQRYFRALRPCIVLISIVVVSAWGIMYAAVAAIAILLSFVPIDHVSAERKRRKDEYVDAEKRWDDLQLRWQNLTSNARFIAKKNDLDAIRQKYLGLKAEYNLGLEKLEQERQQSQLKTYLEHFFIEHARVSGVGPALNATLRSYGIETAADVNRQAVLAVPGIGPKRASDLCDWRRKIEKMFVYDPRRGVDPKEIQALNAKYQEKGRSLTKLTVLGLEELKGIQRQVMEDRRTLVKEVAKVSVIVAQAKADLALCTPK